MGWKLQSPGQGWGLAGEPLPPPPASPRDRRLCRSTEGRGWGLDAAAGTRGSAPLPRVGVRGVSPPALLEPPP